MSKNINQGIDKPTLTLVEGKYDRLSGGIDFQCKQTRYFEKVINTGKGYKKRVLKCLIYDPKTNSNKCYTVSGIRPCLKQPDAYIDLNCSQLRVNIEASHVYFKLIVRPECIEVKGVRYGK